MEHIAHFSHLSRFPAAAAEADTARKAETTQGAETSALPRWDLSALYNSMEDPQLEQDLTDAHTRARAFAARYQGKLGGLSGAELAEAIAASEEIDEILGSGSPQILRQPFPLVYYKSP